MCKFFSFVSNGYGKILYFDHEKRKKILSGEIDVYSPDRHASILDYYGIKGKLQDFWNKYEFLPITRKFIIDKINNRDDSKSMENWVSKLDFKTIVHELNIKPIINPVKDFHRKKPRTNEINLLKKWIAVWDSVCDPVWYSVSDSVRDSVWYSVRDSVCDSVRDSVWDSVCDSVWDSVRDSVWDSVWDSVCDSVWYSVRDSVRDSVWYSVRDSVWYSVWYSVRDSMYAYFSSFFIIHTWKLNNKEYQGNPFLPAIKLWEKGLMPSFDGKIWRLHGDGGKIVYEHKE